jgi:hypothetical protein
LRFRTKWFVVEVLVNKSGPRGNPRLNHENLASWAKTPDCFSEEERQIRYVVQHICKNDRAERSNAERHLPRVNSKLHGGAVENFGRYQP